MSQGVEWAAHCCLTLDWIGSDDPISTAELAAGYELPPSYLNKQLQALSRAGILDSTAGVRGGFRLSRPLSRITLMDVVAAIEGPEEAFRCTEIRQRGAGASAPKKNYRRPCAVSMGMHKAEMAWRRTLADQTLADIQAEAERTAPGLRAQIRAARG
ncbi:MAG TPA: Rrf2 family transcriptional regulator [Mycobacteriales bacterium]|nr:Rrf2 family transcriptional regulator [Mycobacteriales bacterium]